MQVNKLSHCDSEKSQRIKNSPANISLLTSKRTYLLSDVNLSVLSHSISGMDRSYSVTMWPAGLKYHTLQAYIQAYIIWHFAIHKWAYNTSLTSKLYRPIQGRQHVRSLSGPRINYTFKYALNNYQLYLLIITLSTFCLPHPPPPHHTHTHTYTHTHKTIHI